MAWVMRHSPMVVHFSFLAGMSVLAGGYSGGGVLRLGLDLGILFHHDDTNASTNILYFMITASTSFHNRSLC